MMLPDPSAMVRIIQSFEESTMNDHYDDDPPAWYWMLPLFVAIGLLIWWSLR